MILLVWRHFGLLKLGRDPCTQYTGVPPAENYAAQNVSIAEVEIENLSLGQSLSFCEMLLTVGEVSL